LLKTILAPYLSFNERELVRRIAAGDENAFRQLFEQYSDRLFSAAFLLTKSTDLAEDIVQEAFTRLWVKRAELHSIERMDAWLYIIARNLIFERLRKEALADKYRQYIKEYFNEGASCPDEEMEFRELDNTIQQAILQLPPQLQRAFLLSRNKGLSHEEIAREMGISRATVKSYIVQSIASLRRVLSQYSASMLVLLWMEYFL
jgi:RNA polymerase sigma-70 factor (family 1)